MSCDKIALISPSFPKVDFPVVLKTMDFLYNHAKDIVFSQRIERAGLSVEPPPAEAFHPSIGLLSIGAYLEEYGFKVEYLQQDYLERKGIWETCLKKIITDCAVVGFTCLTFSYPEALRVARYVKSRAPEILTVFGGPHVSFCDLEAINDGVDVVVRGEGEMTMLQLAETWGKGKSLSDVRGITYKSGSSIRRNPDQRPLDLEHVPPPAIDLLEQDLLRNSSLAFFTSRGCPFRCTFCSEGRLWGNVRFKSLEKVREEITVYRKNTPFNLLAISDSTFVTSKKRTLSICEMLQKEFPDLRFTAAVRADLMDNYSIKALSETNFIELYVGLESGSNNVLATMNKKETFEDYLTFLSRVKDKFPIISGSWIVGHPGETHATINETLTKIDYLHKHDLLTESTIRIFVPYPGTPVVHNSSKFGLEILTNNWEKFNRRIFPPVHRLATLSEFEIYTSFLHILSTSLRHMLRKAGLENEIADILSGFSEDRPRKFLGLSFLPPVP